METLRHLWAHKPELCRTGGAASKLVEPVRSTPIRLLGQMLHLHVGLNTQGMPARRMVATAQPRIRQPYTSYSKSEGDNRPCLPVCMHSQPHSRWLLTRLCAPTTSAVISSALTSSAKYGPIAYRTSCPNFPWSNACLILTRALQSSNDDLRPQREHA